MGRANVYFFGGCQKSEYVFPGSIPGFYTHLEYIKLAP